MRRILCAWLPNWPTQRLRARNEAPEGPLVTVETINGVRLLDAVSPEAEAAGLRPGMRLAQARAIYARVHVVLADPPAERAALARLAVRCERYTPLAVADPPDGLVLDITGCAHLFGGENGLLADMRARLEGYGLQARLALAGTAGAAWALARARTTDFVLPPGQERKALAGLPIGLLRLDQRDTAGLVRLGVRKVGELARLPRGEVAARFSANVLRRLDQALGDAAEAIVWPHPPEPWCEHRGFAEPIGAPEDLARALATLSEALCARLAAARQGGTRFRACFLRVDGARPVLEAATVLPVREAGYVTRLLVAKLDTLDPGFGIEAMRVEAVRTARLDASQVRLSDLASAERSGLAATVDTLTGRLGEGRVWRPAPVPSHVPERALRRAPPLETDIVWPPDPFPHPFPGPPTRPVRLFARPEPIQAVAPVPDDPPLLFRWRGVVHRIRAASGPERIAAEWWRRRPLPGEPAETERPETDLVRDYYRVEDSEGARFWVFRIGRGIGTTEARWFLHGLFG
jgi:protein ImuB